MFYYLISHWRTSTAVRRKLEKRGGIPVLEHELMPRAEEAGCRPDALRSVAPDEDESALQFIRNWVRVKGLLPVDAPHEIRWKVRYLLHAEGAGLVVERQYRGRNRATKVAEFDLDATLSLRGHIGRSECLNWVKDAILVSFSRERGRGTFMEEEEVLRSGEDRFPVSPKKEALEVVSTPFHLDLQKGTFS